MITGNLDIFLIQNREEFNGNVQNWYDVMIHGDPEGLESMAMLLLKIAKLDQDKIKDIPVGAREHVHLRPKIDLSSSSVNTIIGRLDAKGTGVFYDRYKAAKTK